MTNPAVDALVARGPAHEKAPEERQAGGVHTVVVVAMRTGPQGGDRDALAVPPLVPLPNLGLWGASERPVGPTGSVAYMNLGITELLIVLVILVVLFGAVK